MIQLPRVGWRLVACENGASPDCTIVVVLSDADQRARNVHGHKSAELQRQSLSLIGEVTWESRLPATPPLPPALDNSLP